MSRPYDDIDEIRSINEEIERLEAFSRKISILEADKDTLDVYSTASEASTLEELEARCRSQSHSTHDGCVLEFRAIIADDEELGEIPRFISDFGGTSQEWNPFRGMNLFDDSSQGFLRPFEDRRSSITSGGTTFEWTTNVMRKASNVRIPPSTYTNEGMVQKLSSETTNKQIYCWPIGHNHRPMPFLPRDEFVFAEGRTKILKDVTSTTNKDTYIGHNLEARKKCPAEKALGQLGRSTFRHGHYFVNTTILRVPMGEWHHTI